MINTDNMKIGDIEDNIWSIWQINSRGAFIGTFQVRDEMIYAKKTYEEIFLDFANFSDKMAEFREK